MRARFAAVLLFLFTAIMPGIVLDADAASDLRVPVTAADGQTIETIRCGTVDLPMDEILRIEDELAGLDLQRMGGTRGQSTVTIPVVFHVIRSNSGQWDVSDTQIEDQIDVMNTSFEPIGFQFELQSINRVNNTTWSENADVGSVEVAMKTALAVDPVRTLNFYTVNFQSNLLGYATFPFMYAEDDPMHGVVVYYASMPGGFAAPYNLGATGTHEVGHYVGLYHTFQGGCNGGDQVADTPPEASPASGCPVGRDTCPGGGLDPINNFMDYSTDACMTEFTPLQGERAHDLMEFYRPTMVAEGSAPSAVAVFDAPVEIVEYVAVDEVRTYTLTLTNDTTPDGENLNWSALTTDPAAESCDFVQIDPVSGTLTPGEQVTITLTVGELGLAEGTYDCTAVFNTSDEDNREYRLPIEWNVGLTPAVNVTASWNATSPVNLFSTPGGTGKTLLQAETWSGTVGDIPQFANATILLEVTNERGEPIGNYPRENVTLRSLNGDWSECVSQQLHPASDSDGNGIMRINGALFASGTSVAGDKIVVEVNDPDLGDLVYEGVDGGFEVSVQSADFTDDGLVRLDDAAVFAIDYSGGYTEQSDLQRDGVLNLSDAARFAEAFGSRCEGLELARRAAPVDAYDVVVDARHADGRVDARLVLRGPHAREGVTAWSAGLAPSDNLRVESVVPNEGALSFGQDLELVVGTGRALSSETGEVTLATLRLRAIDDAEATLHVRPIEGDADGLSVVTEVGMVDVAVASGSPENPSLTLNASDDAPAVAVDGLALRAAPNPFNPKTTVHFALRQAGPVSLRIHDVAGRLVRDFRPGTLPAGPAAIEWDGTDDAGRYVASGVYLVRVVAGDQRETTRILLLK